MANYYNIEIIQSYLAGSLSKKEMYQLERDALTDPLLREALEGYETTLTIDNKQISLLQQRIRHRALQQREEKDHFFFGRQRLAIASIAGLLFIVAGILFWLTNFPLKRNPPNSDVQEIAVSLQSEVETIHKGNIEPSIGWIDYQHYLKINNHEKLKGVTVELNFEIENHRPVNIEIVSTGSEKASDEIIRLLQNGPSWEGNAGNLIIKFN